MDFLTKKYLDKYRIQKKMPPEIEGKVEGKILEDQDLLDSWHDWLNTKLKYEVNFLYPKRNKC